MKALIGSWFIFLFAIQIPGQTHNPFYQSLADQVNSDNIIQYLTEFEDLGIKTFGTQEEADALDWLISHYQAAGYQNIETQQVNAYGETGYNLIVNKTGTVYPDTFIIIGAHYDTIYGPGTNDNGSGTSILLELARILADVPTEYSIKFIHFTAEEWGLIGSYQYVEEIAVPQNLDIRLVLNIDEVGGVAGMVNDTVVCEKDTDSPYGNNSQSEQITQELAACIGLYSDLDTSYSHAYASDYIPFQEAGYVITGLYEFNESEHPHTPTDTIENMDPSYVWQIAKGAVGAMAYFSKAYQEMGTDEPAAGGYSIYPNPADGHLFIRSEDVIPAEEIGLYDLSGSRLIHSATANDSTAVINTRNLADGVYMLKIGSKNHKIIVQHK